MSKDSMQEKMIKKAVDLFFEDFMVNWTVEQQFDWIEHTLTNGFSGYKTWTSDELRAEILDLMGDPDDLDMEASNNETDN